MRGFLLNHVISEWLPAQEGFRSANADPVTGQAAWYDLRVRVTKADSPGVTEPHFDPAARPAESPKRVDILRYNTKNREA